LATHELRPAGRVDARRPRRRIDSSASELARVNLKRASGESAAPPAKITFRDFAAKWLQHVEGRGSPKTFEGYEGVLRVHVLPEFGGLLLSQITLEGLDGFVSDWLAAGPSYRRRVEVANKVERQRALEQDREPRKITLGHSPKTVANAIVPLKAMLS